MKQTLLTLRPDEPPCERHRTLSLKEVIKIRGKHFKGKAHFSFADVGEAAGANEIIFVHADGLLPTDACQHAGLARG